MNKTLEIINHLLAVEHACGPVNGLDDLRLRQERQLAIKHHFGILETAIQRLHERVKHLPVLPPLAQVRWAQAVQALPNLAFLELDTTGLSANAEIIRVILLDGQGRVRLDQYIKPSGPFSAEITRITGVVAPDLEHAPTIAEVWARVQAAIKGTYILSYNLDFAKGKLRETARRERLEDITLIGECLMQRAILYDAPSSSYPKLETLCRRIGHSLPEQPYQTAHDRAYGQIHLLNAMASAITGRESVDPSRTDTLVDAEYDLDDIDEHPF